MNPMDTSLHEIGCWSWSRLLATLKESQPLLSSEHSSGIIEKCIDSLTERIALSCEPTPTPSSSSGESPGIRLSFDSKSTESVRNSCSYPVWWFGSLSELNTEMIEKVMKTMIHKKFDHFIISRFLIFYLKSNFTIVNYYEKRKIVEAVINLLFILDWNCIPLKCLVGFFFSSLQIIIPKTSKRKAESMIGSQMENLTVDNLLLPSPSGMKNLYDVDLVIRLLRSFMNQNPQLLSHVRLRKVGALIDLYLAEIAPDPFVQPSKFMSLAMALPDSARDSHDGLYRVMHMYIEIHRGLTEEEKLKLCCGLNYKKLSDGACKHLLENRNFPQRIAVEAVVSSQANLRRLLHDMGCQRSKWLGEKGRSCSNWNSAEDPLESPNAKLKTQLQEMQSSVMELEKMCRKMKIRVSKLIKIRGTATGNSRSLPKLCP